MVYLAEFTGRKAGAGGVMYPVRVAAVGDSEEAARLSLYARHEHIQGLRLIALPGSLYEACEALGIATDSHESDLYLEDSDLTRSLVERYGHTAAPFQNQVTGKASLDVPFAFLPWWNARAAK